MGDSSQDEFPEKIVRDTVTRYQVQRLAEQEESRSKTLSISRLLSVFQNQLKEIDQEPRSDDKTETLRSLYNFFSSSIEKGDLNSKSFELYEKLINTKTIIDGQRKYFDKQYSRIISNPDQRFFDVVQSFLNAKAVTQNSRIVFAELKSLAQYADLIEKLSLEENQGLKEIFLEFGTMFKQQSSLVKDLVDFFDGIFTDKNEKNKAKKLEFLNYLYSSTEIFDNGQHSIALRLLSNLDNLELPALKELADSACHIFKAAKQIDAKYNSLGNSISGIVNVLIKAYETDAFYYESFKEIANNFADRFWMTGKLPDLFLALMDYKVEDLKLPIENYLTALKEKCFDQVHEATGAMGDIIIAQEVIHRSRAGAQHGLNALSIDQHPWRETQSSHLKTGFKQSTEILRKAIDRHMSSIADAYACRKISEDAPWYDQFIDWLKPVVKTNNPFKNQGWKDQSFPGNGWLFQELELNPSLKDYIAKATAWKPTLLYDEDISEFSRIHRSKLILNDLTHSQVIKLRAGVLIIPPKAPNYALNNSFSHHTSGKEHYSFMFYNDHFANPTNTKALMVPTRKVNRVLNDLDGFKSFMAPDFLRNEKDVLDLGSMSIWGGGLCNARLPESSPYFDWEIGGSWPDVRNHKHKYNIRDDESKLRSLQEDHVSVYNLASSFYHMLYQLDLLEAMHVKGFSNSYDFNEENFAYDFSGITKVLYDWSEFYNNKQDDDPGFQAVLVDCDTFDKASKPQWTIKLDPVRWTLTERFANGEEEERVLPGDPEDIQRILAEHFDDYDNFNVQNSDSDFYVQNSTSRTLRFYPKYLT